MSHSPAPWRATEFGDKRVKQLKERPGCVIDVDGKQSVVRSMAVSYWQLVAKDVWEKVE